jgi:hypothetical protein
LNQSWIAKKIGPPNEVSKGINAGAAAEILATFGSIETSFIGVENRGIQISRILKCLTS